MTLRSELVPPGDSGLPKAYALYQNFPNPFNPSTTIRYDIPERNGSVPVRICLYDIRGRLVRRLVDDRMAAGRYQVHWDGRDDRGGAMPSGVYLYRTVAGDYMTTRKMVLAR